MLVMVFCLCLPVEKINVKAHIQESDRTDIVNLEVLASEEFNTLAAVDPNKLCSMYENIVSVEQYVLNLEDTKEIIGAAYYNNQGLANYLGYEAMKTEITIEDKFEKYTYNLLSATTESTDTTTRKGVALSECIRLD